MKKTKRITGIIIIALLTVTIFAGCSKKAKKKITFADAGWDSIKFHNAVAGLIVEEIYGYSWGEVPGTTPVTHEGLLKGEIDIHMEVWTDNIPTYMADLKEGKLKELGVNFDDNYQGFYVPRYVIEGDESRELRLQYRI